MGIYDQVSDALKDAMKAKDKERTTALRNIRAAFISALKEDNSETLSDEVAINHLRRLAKQRHESIEAYTAGGREDLVAAEVAELAVIEAYLPKLADEPTTRAWLVAAIAELGATSKKDMGKVMGIVMKAHKDELDGKLASRLAGELLP